MDKLDILRPCPALLYAVGALVGLVLHHGVFIKGEWHVQAPAILLFHAGAALVLSAGKSTYPFMGQLLLIFFGYLPGLLTSITVYRIFFHPLTKAGFKGPLSARISKLAHVWACRRAQNHLVLADLHEKYGDFVRTGPAEVTVFHPGVFMAIDGPRTECIKAEWYDLLSPSMALVTARTKAVHSARRREWNRGFSAKALAQHETKILRYIDQLDACIEPAAATGTPIEVRDLFFWFGFDAMGCFLFGKSFDMLRQRRWHHIIVRLQRALSLLGYLSPAPWLFQLGFKLAPRVSALRDWFDMVAWCEDVMRQRLEKGNADPQAPDLTHYLMEQDGVQKTDRDSWFWLKGDSLLAIVAGSEPTAVALIGAFCELSKHPDHAERIFEELKGVSATDLKTLTALPHLNAVINETLRLYPALLTGGARKTTENGATIGGIFIPPNTTIVAPRYSISRRSDSFERPLDFIPERWTTQPDMVRNATAFAPFGTGHHSCLGKFLALDMMRYVMARLIKKYRFRLAPGESGLRVLDDLKDQFTSNPGRLRLCFEPRPDS